MSDPIKMTSDELAEIKLLQGKFQEKLFQFGNLYLEKMNVEAAIKDITDRETKHQDEWKSLQKMENELIEKLLKKYGEGALNLKEGVFQPEK